MSAAENVGPGRPLRRPQGSTTSPGITVAGFADVLRERTRAVHQRVEGSSFIAELVTGRRSQQDYAALLGQLSFVYRALENVADRMSADPVAGPFVTAELVRLPRIEEDLEFLAGRSWRREVVVLPATAKYIGRIREVEHWPGGFVAHHYTRYLGDLSGGQIIRTALQRQHGFGTRGVTFYDFPGIARPKLFRDSYRARLDAAPWDESERERILAEVVRAFEHNGAVFDDLAKATAAPAE